MPRRGACLNQRPHATEPVTTLAGCDGTVLKLAVQPLTVLLLARIAGLPELETQVVVLLAALPVGANVYLMSREFNTLEGPVAASLLVSTALAALTVPLVLTLSASH